MILKFILTWLIGTVIVFSVIQFTSSADRREAVGWLGLFITSAVAVAIGLAIIMLLNNLSGV